MNSSFAVSFKASVQKDGGTTHLEQGSGAQLDTIEAVDTAYLRFRETLCLNAGIKNHAVRIISIPTAPISDVTPIFVVFLMAIAYVVGASAEHRRY